MSPGGEVTHIWSVLVRRLFSVNLWLVLLANYVVLDLLFYHTHGSQSKVQWPVNDVQKTVYSSACSSVEAHLPAKAGRMRNPWNQMKWVGEPAACTVKGQLIESLDPFNNFRRGYSLRFVDDVENKTHILPWLLGSKINLNLRKRRVYLDLGANSFKSSIQWFQTMYPCDFTEIHAFEVVETVLKIPIAGPKEKENWSPENPESVRVQEPAGVPEWMLDRIKIHNRFVSDFDNLAMNATNITRFIKEELKLTAADTLVIKMDIEGSEWPILERWIHGQDIADIVDELFVEIHYSDPSMAIFGWDKFNHTREEATWLLAALRAKGFYVHAWP